MKTLFLILIFGSISFAQTFLLLNSGDVLYDADVNTYLKVATSLSDSQKTNINDFVVMLKDSLGITSLSEKFDLIYLMANEDSVSSKLNLVKRDFDGVRFNDLTFTKWQGWTGNGTDAYINTTFNDSVDAVAAKLDNEHWSAYGRVAGANGNAIMGAMETVAAKSSFLIPTLIGARFYYSLQSDAGGFWVANTSNQGLFIASRTANDVSKGYLNGDSLGTNAGESTGLVNNNVIILGRNTGDNTTVNSCSDNQLSFVSIGIGLTTTEARKLNNCVETYLDGIGVGVE